jgi:nucleoside 2-deoxyribosyltransferase
MSPQLFSQDHQNKMLNLICEKIVEKKTAPNGYYWAFYNSGTNSKELSESHKVDINAMMLNYPLSFLDIANRFLLNLANVYPNFGEEIVFDWNFGRLCFPNDFENFEATGMLDLLEQLDYIKSLRYSHIITVSGWRKIEELRKEHITKKQAFVAMAFDDQTIEIREGFRKAIAKAGYTMSIMDEKEHNNQIVPEMLYEIERSRFVVVDVTYPNHGAYYEAGYASGLGKEVIVCCRKTEHDNEETRPHFDIAQKAIVVWENIDDLIDKLKRRIEATIR